MHAPPALSAMPRRHPMQLEINPISASAPRPNTEFRSPPYADTIAPDRALRIGGGSASQRGLRGGGLARLCGARMMHSRRLLLRRRRGIRGRRGGCHDAVGAFRVTDVAKTQDQGKQAEIFGHRVFLREEN